MTSNDSLRWDYNLFKPSLSALSFWRGLELGRGRGSVWCQFPQTIRWCGLDLLLYGHLLMVTCFCFLIHELLIFCLLSFAACVPHRQKASFSASFNCVIKPCTVCLQGTQYHKCTCTLWIDCFLSHSALHINLIHLSAIIWFHIIAQTHSSYNFKLNASSQPVEGGPCIFWTGKPEAPRTQ